MQLDVVVNPFGADAADMVDAARAAEQAGVDGLWVPDHFSGAVLDTPWSRDPFVVLGAWAVATDRARLGVLVANMTNRHPAQLASAVDTVRSLAPGRVVLGVGSGAAPGSRFAVEQEAIGRGLLGVEARRDGLRSTIHALRAIWRARPDHVGAPTSAHGSTSFVGLRGVVEPGEPPPIVVGASAWPTIEVGLELADGVNLRRTAALGEHLHRLADRPDGFEVSVLDGLSDVVRDPSRLDELVAGGVDRIVLGVSPPFEDLAHLLVRVRSVVERAGGELRPGGAG